MSSEKTSPRLQWRHGLIQTSYIGFLAFTCPGMFNALVSLGKGGGEDSLKSAAGLAALYGAFVVFGYFGGPCFNLFGPRILMFVGGMTYVIYALGLIYAKSIALGVLCGMLLGFGAGWFWTGQGALVMSYAPHYRKGFYIAVFWVIFNLGGVVGGFSTMILNWTSTAGSASNVTRISCAVVMFLGASGGLLLVQPKDIIREDNEPCIIPKAAAAWTEAKNALLMVTHRPMQALTLLFFASNFLYAYQFDGINSLYFNIRTRGFNSAMYWMSQMVGAIILGRILDNQNKKPRTRGYLGFLVTAGLLLSIFLADFLYKSFLKPDELKQIYDETLKKFVDPIESVKLDLSDSKQATIPILIYILYGMADAMLQSFSYWMISTLAGANVSLAANYAGYYKGVQSLGAAVSWVLALFLSFNVQLWVGVILVVICLPFSAMCIKNLPED